MAGMDSGAEPAGGSAAAPAPAAPPCNLDQLWDGWVGCIINSECFRGSEKQLGGKAALKHCAKPENMSPHCAALHKAWTDCKFGIVQGAIDQTPSGFANPSSVDLGLSGFNPLASLWNGEQSRAIILRDSPAGCWLLAAGCWLAALRGLAAARCQAVRRQQHVDRISLTRVCACSESRV
eukprot:COSAG06_NODE_1920_length_8063_cov_14.050854_9_plen_179_part_00